MTFSAPVESLDTTSAELREAEPQLPKQHKELAIRAADKIDDMQRTLHDVEAGFALLRSFLGEWADKIEATTTVRLSAMDSDSRNEERVRAAHAQILQVARDMREVSK